MMRIVLMTSVALLLTAFQSAYYGVADQMGYAKREILVDRVEDARDA